MEIINFSLYNIDHDDSKVKKIEDTNQSKEIIEYTHQLFNDIQEAKSKRLFNFSSITTEVISQLLLIFTTDETSSQCSEVIAQRLLEAEKNKIIEMAQLKPDIIPKGILFQAQIREKEENYIILCKADHNKFIDESDLSIRSGLPLKKRIFKAALIPFVDDELQDISIFDSNPGYAKYWWHDFLELQEKHNDSYNTSMAFRLIDQKVMSPLKKRYTADYMILKNSTLGYFRGHENFDIVDYADNIIKEYSPDNQEMDVNKLYKRTLNLPEKYNFDCHFSIEKDVIPKNRIIKIKLHERIELRILDHVESLQSTISSGTDKEGRHYVKIMTDIHHELFKS